MVFDVFDMQYWNPKHLYTRDAPFHVLVTSYNIVILDEKYFKRLKWQYMVLDEAQAMKSSSRFVGCWLLVVVPLA
jgi:chromatin-remodeling ATPase INO80